MPIDANILFQAGRPTVQLDDPLNKLAQLGQVQGFQNQNALAQLQLKQAQQQDQDRTAQSQAWQDAIDPATGKPDYSKVIGNLARAGAGGMIPAVQKSAAEAGKAQREEEAAQFTLGHKKIQTMLDILSGVTDDNSWKIGVQNYASMGGDVSKLPANYDPAYVAAAKSQALTALQRVEQAAKDRGLDIQQQQADEQARNNRANNAIAQGQLGVAQQRLAYDQSQPKGIYDKDNGIIVDQRTGKSIAVTDQNGQPIQGGGGKMTEDQSKATGWLIQAENAFKNMQGAIQRTPSASKPGFNDALASIPSFGAGAALANSLRGADRQQFLQGASSLSEALLRAATGAGVNESEARQKIAEITPVPGDKDENIAQKMAAIPLYLESLRVRAGPGAKKAAAVLSNQPAPAASSDGWTVTQVK